MKKYQLLNLITAGSVAFILWLLYYTYYKGIIDDPAFYLIPPSIFIAFFLSQLMFIFLSTEDEEKAAIISVVIALVTILITFGVLLAIPSKTASKEQTEVVISKLIDCQKYIDCPNNPCSGEDCKKMGFVFYYNDEQIANAIKKYNKNLLDQEKIEQSKKMAEKANKEADKRKAEELDKKLNTMLR